MKVLIIDNLTQTFEGSIVKSGLQKSSKLDAQAFSLFHDTTYAYCGKINDTFNYKHKILSELGAKDLCIKEGISPKTSYVYIRKFLQDLKQEAEEADFIIAHCHSSSMITGINSLVENKNILCIVHDVIDLTWQSGFSNTIKNLKENKKNNIKIYTNSNYSIQKANFNYSRRKKWVDVLSGDDLFDGYIKHFIWTKEVPEIKEKKEFFAIVGRYTKDKFHHMLYDYRNRTHSIIHFGIKDPLRDKGLKYYIKLKRKALYMENLSDEELNEQLKETKAIILPCWHEGFGFTAFEAGIYGAVPIVFVRPFSMTKITFHATHEYLERAGVQHFVVGFDDDPEIIYNTINKAIDITMEERKQISQNLIKYFTVENYVEERINTCI